MTECVCVCACGLEGSACNVIFRGWRAAYKPRSLNDRNEVFVRLRAPRPCDDSWHACGPNEVGLPSA